MPTTPGDPALTSVTPAAVPPLPPNAAAPLQSRRRLAFALYLLALIAAFARPLEELLRFALGHDFCSYIPLIPIVSAYLLWSGRRSLFAHPGRDLPGAIVLAAAGAACTASALAWAGRMNRSDHLSLLALGLVLWLFAGVLAIYGRRVFRAGLFPWLFLLLIIPFPPFLVQHSIYGLQAGSTTLSDWVFRLLGVPVFRHGFDLALPGVTIRVAKECSSIRSSQALAITALLAGYLYLRSPWRRAVLVLVAVPFSVVKNAIRICTLCLLALHVNPGFLYGRLHRQGGFVFFIIALLLLWPLLVWLRRQELRPHAPSSATFRPTA
ncbi:MAG: exosortase/archaeosortase family protein [Terriglobales bacterium]